MNQPKVIKNLATDECQKPQVVRVGQPETVNFIPDHHHAPHVECVREGGVVRRIEVTCECGQVIRLVCCYDEEGS